MRREDLINQRATTCRHGGHCEWVACDKCNHYEPKSETITNDTSGYLEVVLPECEDCISRQAVLDTLDNHKYSKEFCEEHHIDWSINLDMANIAINDLPPVTPNEKTGYCKDCKWWKDSDGVFRRGVGAESKCPINRKEVYEGNGYCFLFEPQESEDKEFRQA